MHVNTCTLIGHLTAIIPPYVRAFSTYLLLSGNIAKLSSCFYSSSISPILLNTTSKLQTTDLELGNLRVKEDKDTIKLKMSLTKLAAFGTRHIARGVGRLSQEVLETGAGSYVVTTEGRRLLDFTSGIGVTNLGHCHPAVTKAAQEQVGKIVHAQINIAFSKSYLGLVESMLPLMPDGSLDAFFFWNSGAEAVEAAVKLVCLLFRCYEAEN